MSPLVFKDPPPPTTGAGGVASAAHLRSAAEMRANTGQWAILTTAASASRAGGLTKRIVSGRIIAFAPEGEFKACYRNEGGKFVVYAMHVGPPAAVAPAKPKLAARTIAPAAAPARRRRSVGGGL